MEQLNRCQAVIRRRDFRPDFAVPHGGLGGWWGEVVLVGMHLELGSDAPARLDPAQCFNCYPLLEVLGKRRLVDISQPFVCQLTTP